MKNIYDYVIFGATFFGTACAQERNSLIIDSVSNPGHEFIDSLHLSDCTMSRKCSDFTEFFMQSLIKKKLLDCHGKLHLYPVGNMLSTLLEDSEVLLNTVVTGVEKADEGYKISIVNSDGKSEIFAKHIVDTTSEGIFGQFGDKSRKKLGAMLTGCDDDPRLIKGISEQVYLTDAAGDYPESRKKLMDELAGFNAFGGKITSIGAEFCHLFDYSITYTLDDNYTWAPSESYGDILTALETGLYFDRPVKYISGYEDGFDF